MVRKVDTTEFIRMAINKHGDKYDYSKSEYTRSKDNIIIICPKHGEFSQRASNHLSGSGCPRCFQEKNRDKGLICGVGINDIRQSDMKLFFCWRDMLYRCYGKKINGYNKAYSNCVVSKEWLRLSSFAKWFYDNYHDGWQLDKDILSNGEKIYSSKTCCFVPNEINMLLVKADAKGMTFVKHAWQAAYAGKYLGRYQTPEDARTAYNRAKFEHMNTLIENFKSQLREDVYVRLKKHALRLCGLNELANNFKVV